MYVISSFVSIFPCNHFSSVAASLNLPIEFNAKNTKIKPAQKPRSGMTTTVHQNHASQKQTSATLWAKEVIFTPETYCIASKHRDKSSVYAKASDMSMISTK